MAFTSSTMNWQDWLTRWDIQQTRYIPEREERFDVMLDVLGRLLPDSFVALDLACGPGAISQRLLTRFPQARSIAVDMNPVLLKLGEQAVGDVEGRLAWAEVNLLQTTWVDTVRDLLRARGSTHVDAVLSTTALHWLPAEDLTRVYRQLGQIVRPGGIFLNGDNLPFAPWQPTFRRLSEQVRADTHRQTFQAQDAEDYAQWWQALEQAALEADPSLSDLFAAYHLTETERPRNFAKPSLALHSIALHEAGFSEVDTIWQKMGLRVLMAIKGSES